MTLGIVSRGNAQALVDPVIAALALKANLSGAAFTGPISVAGAVSATGSLSTEGNLVVGATAASARLHALVGSVGAGTLAQTMIGYGGGSVNYFDANTQIFRNGSAVECTRIDASGNLLVGISSAVANSGAIQTKNGVGFPATQVACSDPNTLDDYEEGTWTPTITGATTSGTASYTTQTGVYTKVGRQVTISGRVAWSAANGTGVMQISGLPFTSSSATNFVANILPTTLAAGDITHVAGYVPGSSTSVQLYKYAAGAGASIAVEASGEVVMTMTYST